MICVYIHTVYVCVCVYSKGYIYTFTYLRMFACVCMYSKRYVYAYMRMYVYKYVIACVYIQKGYGHPYMRMYVWALLRNVGKEESECRHRHVHMRIHEHAYASVYAYVYIYIRMCVWMYGQFYETSAKKNLNVDQAFTDIARDVMRRLQEQVSVDVTYVYDDVTYVYDDLTCV